MTSQFIGNIIGNGFEYLETAKLTVFYNYDPSFPKQLIMIPKVIIYYVLQLHHYLNQPIIKVKLNDLVELEYSLNLL